MNRASQMTHELNEVYSLWSRERLRVSRAGERGRENDVGVFVRPFQFFDGRKLVHNKCVGTAGATLACGFSARAGAERRREERVAVGLAGTCGQQEQVGQAPFYRYGRVPTLSFF